jgi:hypothetical protein
LFSLFPLKLGKKKAYLVKEISADWERELCAYAFLGKETESTGSLWLFASLVHRQCECRCTDVSEMREGEKKVRRKKSLWYQIVQHEHHRSH